MNEPNNSGEQKSALRQGHRQEDELRRLFESARDSDEVAMSTLVAEYSQVVRTVVGELIGRLDKTTLEDQAEQALRIAIMDADLTKLAKFRAFARKCIRHDLVNLIRELSEGSRNDFEVYAEFQTAKHTLMKEDGNKAPTDEEVFDVLGWGKTKRRNFQRTSRSRDIGDISEFDTSRGESQRVMEIRIEKEKRISIVRETMKRLPELQREALKQRYYVSNSISRKDYAKSKGETEHEIRKRERLGLAAIKAAIEEHEDKA